MEIVFLRWFIVLLLFHYHCILVWWYIFKKNCSVDSGVYTMMFLEHWTSPRSPVFSLFSSEDIPNLRIKIANDMVFNPRNSGDKNPVISYDHNQVLYSFPACTFLLFYFSWLYLMNCYRKMALSSCCWCLLYVRIKFLNFLFLLCKYSNGALIFCQRAVLCNMVGAYNVPYKLNVLWCTWYTETEKIYYSS